VKNEIKRIQYKNRRNNTNDDINFKSIDLDAIDENRERKVKKK
jgi:hypothetical protein